MPLQATSGAASYDAFGGGAAAGPPTYIEDVFSTYLINLLAGTGNQQIPHGLDLSTYGGLTWVKNRASAYGNTLGTTNIGTSKMLFTNTTDAVTSAASFVSFDTNGTTITRAGGYFGNSNEPIVSWNFRKQPKFFDIQTWTGSGANRTISHSLGSVPGSIIVKRTDTTGAWQVYHRSLANTEYLVLNTTAAKATGATRWNSTTPTSSVFSLGTDATVNASGGTYIAYLFAHDAGGFGLTGTDNVISCGSYTGNGVVAGPSVTLGYEPQWVLIKSSTVAGSHWYLMDIMRGMAYTQCNELYANLDAAEVAQSKTIIPTATGFDVATNDAYINNNGSTYIYIAIRRGPMKVPTDATKVFAPVLRTGTGSVTSLTSLNFPPDMLMARKPSPANTWNFVVDRLRGYSPSLTTQVTDAEQADTLLTAFGIRGVTYDGTASGINQSGQSYINYFMGRAPSFFDEVCFTTDGSGNFTGNHNLGVTPELIITKRRNSSGQWWTYSAYSGTSPLQRWLLLNDVNGASGTGTAWWATSATSFSVLNGLLAASATNVAYLFATCPGVSKVGSYTGNGTTQTIDCGFGASGARFVLIKRTDTDGAWYVYDTARGMTVLTDPYLLLNTTAAEVATLGSVTTVSTGFAVNAAILAAINTNAASYIFLAIA